MKDGWQTRRTWRRRLRVTLGVFAAALAAPACTAERTDGPWPLECVGRLTVRLPGEVDIPGMTVEQFLNNSESRAYKFEDGQDAFYSKFQYGGSVAITPPVTAVQSQLLIAKQRERFRTVQKMAEKGEMRSSDGTRFKVSPINSSDAAIGWKIFNKNEATVVGYPKVTGQAIGWILAGSADQVNSIYGAFEEFQNGVRARSVFTVPAETGVCMPHLFVQDNGENYGGRLVAVTYRLREHPDVTIMIMDATATTVAEHGGAEKYSAVYRSNFFWTQDYQHAKSMSSLLHGGHNVIKLAGRDAIETMVRLVRADNTEDFGYLAVSNGKSGAAVDTPDVMMYVIRNANNARKKGVAPLPKDRFFTIAKGVAASVKHQRDK